MLNGLNQPNMLKGLMQSMAAVMMLMVMMVLITMTMVSVTMPLVMKTVHEHAAGDNNTDDDVDENAECDSWDDDV